MRLLDQVRQVLRVRHYSYRTEQCYLGWITNYLRFCKGEGAWKHPRELGAPDGGGAEADRQASPGPALGDGAAGRPGGGQGYKPDARQSAGHEAGRHRRLAQSD